MELYRLLNVPIFGKRTIKKVILKRENGEMESKTIRQYYKNIHKMTVGKYSYGCFEKDFNYATAGNIVIGRYCSFGSGCHYFGANHPVERATTCPIFYRDIFGYDVDDVPRYNLQIGNDVWFGYGVLVTCGCQKIGNGAVIAAGSVVTKDVPPYAIVAGIPGKVMKYRFDRETIDQLEKSRWYELEPDQIMEYYEYINQPLVFGRKIAESK